MRNISIGNTYRHFKGSLYTVITVAEHTETNEQLVIYSDIVTGNIYARPFEMFNSKVDRNKYPNTTQEYRFEQVIV